MSEFRKMTATTFAGLEELLASELAGLGAKGATPVRRAVEFSGDQEVLYRAAIHSRLALRLVVPLRRLKFRTADEMYRQALTIAWDKYFTVDDTFAVRVAGSHPAFRNTMFAAQRLKDSIADSFRKRGGTRPNVQTKNPDIPVHLHLSSTGASISLDASGEPLFQRGWRQETGEAPLNEIVASAILMLGSYDGTEALVDPMSGSGTFAVEAAMIAKHVAPGLLGRSYAFQKWRDYDKELFDRLIEEAKSEALEKVPNRILGADSDKSVMKKARRNAARANVDRDVRFITCAFEDLKPPEELEEGILVINPPYDERMKIEDLKAFYSTIGDALKQNWTGWRAYILTGNLQAAKSIGLRTSRRIPLWNGGIECRLLEFELYSGSRKESKNSE